MSLIDEQIRILTLNCWGLKFFSKDRKERITGIADRLSECDHDIIALQELWVRDDYYLIRQSVSPNLPFAKFFYSGALGSGLALFSRFPIIEASVHPYSLNGSPIEVAKGDWFVGKAAAFIVIEHPVLGQVQIFNTHFYAKGGEDGPEHNRAHRLVNAWEFAKLAKQAANLGRYVIATGDFNSIPTTLPMTIIRDYVGFADCWSVTHRNTTSSTPSANNSSTPLDAINKFGITADSPLNSYSAGKPLDQHARKYLGKRLDYIFYRQPAQSDVRDAPVLRCKECKVVLTEHVPGYDFSFSDHFGLEATLEFSSPGDAQQPSRFAPSTSNYESSAPKPSALSIASVTETEEALYACYRFSNRRSRQELMVFVLCIIFLLAFVVGSAWLPSYQWINPVSLFVTIFISWLATTMLYEGFIYGRWERNALTNAIEDLYLYKKAIEAQPDS